MLQLGSQRPLEASDIEKIRKIETSDYQKEKLRPMLNKYISRKDDKYALLKALYSRFCFDILLLTIVGSLATLMDFSGALFIGIIEDFLESDDPI